MPFANSAKTRSRASRFRATSSSSRNFRSPSPARCRSSECGKWPSRSSGWKMRPRLKRRNLRLNPVPTIHKRLGLVGFAAGEALVFALGGPEQNRADEGSQQARGRPELLFDIPPQLPNSRGNGRIGPLQAFLHDPERGIVGGAQFGGFVGDALAHAHVGMVVVALPTLKDGVADAEEAGAVALKIEAEGPIKKALRFVARDGGVLKVKLELSMDIGQVNVT